MGVYIKGMEMPKDCIVCPFGWNGCNKQHDFVYMGSRPDFCPNIDVHEPHGRLIDADALIEDLKRQCKEVFRIDAVSPDDYWITRNEAYNEALWKSWVESFGDYLKSRPTIIAAEGGRQNHDALHKK